MPLDLPSQNQYYLKKVKIKLGNEKYFVENELEFVQHLLQMRINFPLTNVRNGLLRVFFGVFSPM
jgi:hypothetical protein